MESLPPSIRGLNQIILCDQQHSKRNYHYLLKYLGVSSASLPDPPAFDQILVGNAQITDVPQYDKKPILNCGSETCLIEIKIDRNFQDFDDHDQELLLNGIRNLLKIANIKITNKRSGSVILTIELTREQSTKLLEEIKAGNFDGYRVVEAMILDKGDGKEGDGAPQNKAMSGPTDEQNATDVRQRSLFVNDLIISNECFLSEFEQHHKHRRDRPFCWILGSGASQPSGIPTGQKLVTDWLNYMYRIARHRQLPKPNIEQWANEEFSDVRDFKYSDAVDFYANIYQRRFKGRPHDGYAFLEETMQNVKPSYGYVALAQIMAATAHRVAITTNFDNLVHDSLLLYTETRPLHCGHEALADFVTHTPRQPLIVQLHRNLYFSPLNTPDEISNLAKEWHEPLGRIFQNYIPIIIGYGDVGKSGGSLMKFINALPRPLEKLYWCFRDTPNKPIHANVQSLVRAHNGSLVPIMGFDELMLQLSEILQLPDFRKQLQMKCKDVIETSSFRFESLRDAVISKKPKLGSPPIADQTLLTTIESVEANIARLNKDCLD